MSKPARMFSTWLSCGLCIILLAACTTPLPPRTVDAATPPSWQAPLPASLAPHGGSSPELADWWQKNGDRLLSELIDAAQRVSPTVAAAKSRIEQARANRVAAGAALLPAVNGAANVSRNSAQPPLPLSSVAQAAVQPSWEIDLFGAARNTRDAAQARLEGAGAGWHEARVAVAAEVANQYAGLRACRLVAGIVQADAASRAETARLTSLSAGAGFQAPATAALAQASAAEANSRAIQQRAQCDLDVKSLIALTAVPEAELRLKLDAAPADLALPLALSLDALPARVLSQRPDLFTAERNVAAASEEVGSAEAQRYPRLSLSGSIGIAAFRASGLTASLNTWSVGPVALTVPLYDAGQRRANADAARARYDEAASQYRALVRQAVREVEQALVSLHSTDARLADARAAVEGYRTALTAMEERYRNGFASLIELEDVRRTRLAAETALVTLQRDRLLSAIALYRAAGGNWDGDPMPDVTAARVAPTSKELNQ